MNERFTNKQIEVYASSFREGDAIWCGGEWHEVLEDQIHFSRLSAYAEGNSFIVNEGSDGNFQGVNFGFSRTSTSKNPYRVTTLNHYKLKGGEKIVGLDEDDNITFGKIHTVYMKGETPFVDFGNTIEGTPTNGDAWGVIPRYEQVKSINTKEDEQLSIEEAKKKHSIYEQVANRHNITKEELSFILDECDNGRKSYIIDCLITLRNEWHESN